MASNQSNRILVMESDATQTHLGQRILVSNALPGGGNKRHLPQRKQFSYYDAPKCSKPYFMDTTRTGCHSVSQVDLTVGHATGQNVRWRVFSLAAVQGGALLIQHLGIGYHGGRQIIASSDRLVRYPDASRFPPRSQPAPELSDIKDVTTIRPVWYESC